MKATSVNPADKHQDTVLSSRPVTYQYVSTVYEVSLQGLKSGNVII